MATATVDVVVPDGGPGAAQVTLAGGPGIGSIEVEADNRIRQPKLRVLLDQIIGNPSALAPASAAAPFSTLRRLLVVTAGSSPVCGACTPIRRYATI